MDRGIVFVGAIPLDSDWLVPQRSAMVGLAGLSEAVLGTNTVIDGLRVNPTSPTSLAVQVEAGQLYARASLDALAYGSLPADVAHSIVKQGIQLDPLRIAIQPPGTPGFSQTFLVQAAFQEVEAGSAVLPYYNSANPSQPYSGPNNSGAQQYTQRNGRVVVQVKAGAPASTGSQPVPTPDPGWVGLAWVTVASGAAVILTQHITQYPGPHRILHKLPALGRVAGGAITTVTGTRDLTADEAGLVIVDLGAGFDDAQIRLPPASSVPGVPMRFVFVGRYVTPRSRRQLSWGRIVGSSGDVLERTFYYCGPNDTLEVVSDGASRWYVARGKPGFLFDGVAAGNQVIPSTIRTAVNLSTPAGANLGANWWSAATPSRMTFSVYGRYVVTAGISFIGGANAGLREMLVMINGNVAGTPLPWVAIPAVQSESTILTASSGPFGLFDGDYIELYCRQTSGVPVTLDGGRTFLSVEMAAP